MLEYLQEPITGVSVLIPCKDEAECIRSTVTQVRAALATLSIATEVIVIDDGSTDNGREEALAAGARVLVHSINMGYGKAILNGMSVAKYPVIAITDADGTYPIAELPKLIAQAAHHDLVIGRRSFNRRNSSIVGMVFRRLLYFLILYLSNVRADDYNSGFRVFRRSHTLPYHNLLCPKFSFTTSQTLVHLLTHRSIYFHPIVYSKRIGRSKVAYFKDALRTFSYVFLIANIFQAYRLTLIFVLAGMATSMLVLAAGLLLHLEPATVLGIQAVLGVGFVLSVMALIIQPLAKLNVARFEDAE